jgi:hypothetical protein
MSPALAHLSYPGKKSHWAFPNVGQSGSSGFRASQTKKEVTKMHLSNWQATTTYQDVLLSLNNRNNGYVHILNPHLSYMYHILSKIAFV